MTREGLHEIARYYLNISQAVDDSPFVAFADAVIALAAPKGESEGSIRARELEEAIRVAQTTPFRAHAVTDENFHSGCVQTRDRIVAALRALADATKDASGTEEGR